MERQVLRVDFIVFVDHIITCRRVEELYTLNGTGTMYAWSVSNLPWKSSLASFLPSWSNSSHCSFSISFTLVWFWFLVSVLSLQYFSTSCNTFWNSVGEMSSSWITCEMILVMLSNLLWANSLLASFFPCFTVWLLEIFVWELLKGKELPRTCLRQYQRASQHLWQILE